MDSPLGIILMFSSLKMKQNKALFINETRWELMWEQGFDENGKRIESASGRCFFTEAKDDNVLCN